VTWTARVHRFTLPQYLLVARVLLVEPELSSLPAAVAAAASAPGASLDSTMAAAAASGTPMKQLRIVHVRG
jgi:hypothetical protein